MTRFSNFKLCIFRHYQKAKAIFKKEKYETESFYETFKIPKISIKYF